MWLQRDLSISGQIFLSKSEGFSRLVYTAMVLDVPPKKVKQIDTEIFNFIWKNKPHQLKQTVLCNPYCQGGLNALDFNTSNTVFKIKWLKRYLRGKIKLWYIIPELIFKKIRGIEFLLNCYYSVDKLPVNLASFHKQALLSWMLVYKHNFSPQKCLIWNNQNIRYKNKSLFFKKWFGQNILFVTVIE